jgi:hypothetical protein
MTTQRLDKVGETKRLISKMESWGREEYIDWYRNELRRIETLAFRSSPAVRATLEWSLPFFRGVIAGEIEPVLPPPPKPRMTRMMHHFEREPTRPKLRINAKRKAGVTNPAMA